MKKPSLFQVFATLTVLFVLGAFAVGAWKLVQKTKSMPVVVTASTTASSTEKDIIFHPAIVTAKDSRYSSIEGLRLWPATIKTDPMSVLTEVKTLSGRIRLAAEVLKKNNCEVVLGDNYVKVTVPRTNFHKTTLEVRGSEEASYRVSTSDIFDAVGFNPASKVQITGYETCVQYGVSEEGTSLEAKSHMTMVDTDAAGEAKASETQDLADTALVQSQHVLKVEQFVVFCENEAAKLRP